MGEFKQSLFGYKKQEVDLFLTEVKELQSKIKVMQKLLQHLNNKNHEIVVSIEKSMADLLKNSKREIQIQEQALRHLQSREKELV